MKRIFYRGIFYRGVLLAGLAGLTACAAPQRINEAERRLDREIPAQDVAAVHTDLVRSMLMKEQYYAALAHIEELSNRYGNNNELRLLKADALRELQRDNEAETIYQALQNGLYSAEAYHGLGLIYSKRNPAYGMRYLAQAVLKQPTNVQMRNDYGFALIKARRYEQALTQLATAVELSPSNDRARNNLLILLILTGDEAGVRRVAAAGGLDNQTLATLRRQAAMMRSPAAP